MKAVNIGRTFSRSLKRGIMMKSLMITKNACSECTSPGVDEGNRLARL